MGSQPGVREGESGGGAHREGTCKVGDVQRDGAREDVAGGCSVEHVVAAAVVVAKLMVLRLVPGALPVCDDLAALHAARVDRIPRVVLRQHLCKPDRTRQRIDLRRGGASQQTRIGDTCSSIRLMQVTWPPSTRT